MRNGGCLRKRGDRIEAQCVYSLLRRCNRDGACLLIPIDLCTKLLAKKAKRDQCIAIYGLRLYGQADGISINGCLCAVQCQLYTYSVCPASFNSGDSLCFRVPCNLNAQRFGDSAKRHQGCSFNHDRLCWETEWVTIKHDTDWGGGLSSLRRRNPGKDSAH
ncbi:hypothetical protein D3C77_523130 [compost metagenome]